ncbi:Glutathione import ATP-binding protein GsiA [compost metagenome]
MVTHDLAVVDHMCDRFAVMLRGEITEILPREAIADNRATHPYARELIGASLEYEGA